MPNEGVPVIEIELIVGCVLHEYDKKSKKIMRS